MSTLAITGGRVVDPANGLDGPADVFIADGRIVAVGPAPPDGFRPEQTLDASSRVVAPGLVDLAARLREPGQEHKATIASECAAAVAGGITTLCMPPDTHPVVDTAAVVEVIHQRAEAAGAARVVTLGALTVGLEGTQLAEMAELKRAGCVGVSNALRPVHDTLVLRRALEYAASHDLTVFVHPEDPHLAQEGCVHEGVVATRLGLPGIPASAETVAVAQILMLLEQVPARVHFCRLSAARSVNLLARAQYDGMPVTADVAAHQLHLTEMDIGFFDNNCHLRPPLRTRRDLEGLRAGLVRGTVTAICSDHQPHDSDAKLAPFCETEPGISALETLLPLALRLTGGDEPLDLAAVIARLTCEPARVLGLAAGTLSPGAAADVCIFDPHAHWTVEPDRLVSRGRNTPFAGWELEGQVTHTLVGGRVVFQRENPP